MYLLLFCSWLSYIPLPGEIQWEVLDFFAGEAKISKLASALGLQAAAFDICMAPPKRKRRSTWIPSRSVMDMNSDSGFLLLATIHLETMLCPQVSLGPSKLKAQLISHFPT